MLFDPIRKKYVAHTPEEEVRQQFIQYLIHDRQVPASLIRVEVAIKVHRLKRRIDIVVYSRKGIALLAVECKAPKVKITQATFDQLARYNLEIKVPNLIITNGLNHYFCKIDLLNKTYQFENEIPLYNDLCDMCIT